MSTARWVALLRGINVSGQKKIRMADLRSWMAEEGFTNVETYIQSGNLVFEAQGNDAAALAGQIQSMLAQRTGFDVPTLVVNSDYLSELIENTPYSGEEKFRLVTFLAAPAPADSITQVQALARGEDVCTFCSDRTAVYLYTPGGYGKTKLSNTAIERKTGQQATTRNWKTIHQLHTMASL